MLRARISKAKHKNTRIETLPRKRGEKNAAWLGRARASLDGGGPQLLLLGGTAVPDFRVRVAQGPLRNDTMPSFWSHVGLLLPGKGKSAAPALWHVPLDVGDALTVPARNAVARDKLDYAAGERFANLALLEFPGGDAKLVAQGAEHLERARLELDLVAPLVRWLGHVWGAGSQENPLLGGVPLPSASFVEAAFANGGLDLAPGMTDRVHCPEAIWQAALWWADYYQGDEGKSAPRGAVTIGQEAAAIVE